MTAGNLAFDVAPAIDVGTGELTFTATNGTAGTATVTVTVEDTGPIGPGHDNTSAPQSFELTVQDSIPPQIHSCHLARGVLWPATRGLLPAGIAVTATDNLAVTGFEVTVYSDEPHGAAPYAPDASFTGAPASLKLRAERAFPGVGRVYVVAVRAVDAAGNRSGVCCATCVVPIAATTGHLVALQARASAAAVECEAGGSAAPTTGTWTTLFSLP